MYLNTKALSKLLSENNPTQPLYLGHFPVVKPWEVYLLIILLKLHSIPHYSWIHIDYQ